MFMRMHGLGFGVERPRVFSGVYRVVGRCRFGGIVLRAGAKYDLSVFLKQLDREPADLVAPEDRT